MYTCKNLCLLVFRLLRSGVQPEEDEEEHGKTVKYHNIITRITPVLQDFSMSLVFNMFFTLTLAEVKLNGI